MCCCCSSANAAGGIARHALPALFLRICNSAPQLPAVACVCVRCLLLPLQLLNFLLLQPQLRQSQCCRWHRTPITGCMSPFAVLSCQLLCAPLLPLLPLQLPKFLQPYAHMLGQNKQQDEDAPAVLQEQQRRLDREEDEEQDKADEEVGEAAAGPDVTPTSHVIGS